VPAGPIPKRQEEHTRGLPQGERDLRTDEMVRAFKALNRQTDHR
jgi:hypothetical protein